MIGGDNTPRNEFPHSVDAVGTLIAERPPQSGRALARIGLRMMPTFPLSPPISIVLTGAVWLG